MDGELWVRGQTWLSRLVKARLFRIPWPSGFHKAPCIGLAVSLLVPVFWIGSQVPASATVSCETLAGAQVGGADTNGGLNNTQNGIRGSVYFASGSGTPCNRVASLTTLGPLDRSGDRQFYEFGWVIGYSNCNEHYYSSPRMFVWWNLHGAGPHCEVLPYSPTPGERHHLRGADTNQDGLWSGYLDYAKINESIQDVEFI